MKIFHSAKTQGWVETIVTSSLVVFIIYWTISNANLQAKFFIPIATVMGLGVEIKRITDLNSQEEISKLNTQIKALEVELKDIKSGNKFVNDLVIHLEKNSNEMDKLVNKLGENPQINNSIIYREIKDKINNYLKKTKNN